MKRLVVFVLVCLALSACMAGSRREKAYSKLVDASDINNQLRLNYWIPEYKNHLRISDCFTVELSNRTSKLIGYSFDKDLRIYTFNKQLNEWVDIDNTTVYEPPEEFLSPKGEKSPGITPISLCQALGGINREITIRVVLTGKVYKDELTPTVEKVSAYIDIKLKSHNQG